MRDWIKVRECMGRVWVMGWVKCTRVLLYGLDEMRLVGG